MGGRASSSGWVFRAGAAHAFVGLSLLFLTLHPLRDALSAQALALVQVMTTVQATNGVALIALAPRLSGWLAPGLIAGGVAASLVMVLIIAFTGQHPFDLMVPLGGLAMMLGWLAILLGKGLA